MPHMDICLAVIYLTAGIEIWFDTQYHHVVRPRIAIKNAL